MIKNLSIQNFRSHREVVLRDCGRINILLGRNNSGKTALLEAVVLLCFPPNPREVLTLLNEQRGYKPGDENSEFWDSYFHNWNHLQVISLGVEEIPSFTRLSICRNLFIVPILGFPGQVTSGSVIETHDVQEKTQGLSFKYQYEDGYIEQKVTTLRRKTNKQLSPKAKAIIDHILPMAFIPSKGISNPQDEAERFSRLEKANRHHEVEEVLRSVESRLKRLTVLTNGQGSMVYGDIGEGHLIPVSLMGEGMVRMLSIATAMVNNKGGLVLIDEIENGLHYSALPTLWQMIFKTARQFDVQVFTATHSDECIQAASDIAQTYNGNDLKLYRLDIIREQTVITEYSSEELAAAIASNQEVR